MSSHQLFWGDIHNHNELGYGQGSLTRSYEIAESHLDFYAFTPHAQHADGNAPKGYESVNSNWDAIVKAAAEYNKPGKFTTFLAHEWHSKKWGHVHVVHLTDHKPLHFASSLAELQAHFRGQDVILVPHHIAYSDGVDWELFDESLSPVVEIFSEHGCSERDVGAFPMLGHSGGPGGVQFTAQHGLALGKRFGFAAGTDNHDGYPGGYGLGLTGVWAKENTRKAIWEGIQNRRTIAVTGDRIGVDFHAGDAPMGSIVSPDQSYDLKFSATGWDFIRQIELVKNNIPVSVTMPNYQVQTDEGEQVYRLRFEWGWGPMKGYQVFDWEGSVSVEGGELQQAVPCFVSDPYDDVKRKKIVAQDEAGCLWQSHTSRGGILVTRNSTPACSVNDALCLEVRGTKDTLVNLEMFCQTKKSLLATPADWSIANGSASIQKSFRIGTLLEGSDGFRMSGLPSWVKVHRAVPETLFHLEGSYQHNAGDEAVYYVRVMQENGQMAWSSPIWISAE